MMRLVSDQSWTRRGLGLLWGSEALSRVTQPNGVLSVRKLFAARNSWPDELPSAGGNALVVAGVDGCLDSMTPEDATRWLEEDLRPLVVGFQDHFENQAALILWIPDGRRRIVMPRATEQYEWHCTGAHRGEVLPLGRCIWAGADADVRRIIDPSEPNQDSDGAAWIGLNHPRIS